MGSGSESNVDIRKRLKALFMKLLKEEQTRNHKIVLIMLEVGKEIVPVDKNDKRLRDLMGWITQDTAQLSDEVEFVWNGFLRN